MVAVLDCKLLLGRGAVVYEGRSRPIFTQHLLGSPASLYILHKLTHV